MICLGVQPGERILRMCFIMLVQSVMHINLHFLRRIFPEAQAFIKVLVTQFHSEAADLAWA